MDDGMGGGGFREDGNYKGIRAWGGCLVWYIPRLPRVSRGRSMKRWYFDFREHGFAQYTLVDSECSRW